MYNHQIAAERTRRGLFDSQDRRRDRAPEQSAARAPNTWLTISAIAPLRVVALQIAKLKPSSLFQPAINATSFCAPRGEISRRARGAGRGRPRSARSRGPARPRGSSSAGRARNSLSVLPRRACARIRARSASACGEALRARRVGEAKQRRRSRRSRARTSPLASGEAISAQTAMEPADSPRDRHRAGIAAEGGDVAPDPLQRRNKVKHPVVARGALFGREFGMREKTERIEPMVDGDDDDASRGELCAVVARLGARPDDEAAAVNPEQHRQARGLARPHGRPDVEIEAILGDAGAGSDRCRRRRCPASSCRPNFGRRARSGPGRDGLRGPPAQARRPGARHRGCP